MVLESADVREDEDGNKWIVISHQDGPLDFIPLVAVAERAEVLGYSDAVDAIEADAVYKELTESGEIDGEFPCDEQFEILKLRERAREAEAQKCHDENKCIADYDAAIRRGCDTEEKRNLARRLPETPDPRSAKLRGALAARKAVLDISGCEKDSDSVLVKAQAEARAKIKACCPERNPTSAARHVAFTADETPHSAPSESAQRFLSAEDRRKVAQALRGNEESMARSRRALLHTLAGNKEDPLAEEEETRVSDRATIDGIREKYKA